MSLTKKQEEGLKIVIDRYKQKIPYTIIAGYASSDKSFLVKLKKILIIFLYTISNKRRY